jgi:hypothetical protein
MLQSGKKILIIGDGGHGKDSVAEVLALHGLTFISSSYHCAAVAVRPALEAIGVFYDNLEDCYEDRRNHREFWKATISEYNNPKDRLAQEICELSDIYVGLRKRDEFDAARHLFDYIIWVDASDRLPPEPTNELVPWDAHAVIDNNGSKELMRAEANRLGNFITIKLG